MKAGLDWGTGRNPETGWCQGEVGHCHSAHAEGMGSADCLGDPVPMRTMMRLLLLLLGLQRGPRQGQGKETVGDLQVDLN